MAHSLAVGFELFPSFSAEASRDETLTAHGQAMGEMAGRIAKLKAEIDNVECPPDDSMFNQVTQC